MIRKLAFAMAALSLFISGLANALGLGEAEVKSALNQPLRAEIELVSVKGLQENEILPGLATREEFLKAGVDRVYFLSDLRFKVEKKADGRMVVILTSAKPVREPFLNFLVEVIWPSGRLLREYALLIDPPLFAEEPAVPVAAPAVTSAPAPRADRVAIPAPAPVPQRVVSSSSASADTYGPTESNDTLWEIAAKVRPNRSVSPQQVMLAIQDLNPGAFINDNINKLKAGQVLRLPTLEQIQQRSPATAINEVIAQNQALRPKKSKPVVSAAQTAASPAPVTGTARGGDELKLLVAKDDDAAGGTANSGDETQAGSGKGVDAEMAITLEKLDKANLENEELSGRVEDLEEQLATLQRLLALKNDQLAGLQAQARAQEEEKLKAEMESAATQTEDAAATSELAMVEQAGDQPAASDTQADAEALVTDEEVEDESAQSAEAAEVVAPVQPEPKPAPVKQTAEQTSGSTGNIFDLILSNPLYQAAVAAGLIVLLIILWIVSKQNAKREQMAHAGQDSAYAEDESDFDQDSDQEQGYAEEADDYEEEYDEDYTDEPVGEEFEESAAGEPESDEKGGEAEDVIAEADVYIAYGRLDQAATVLEQGISSDPVRADYRLKLLEVYAETGDNEAFDRQLSELEAIQDPDAMEKALAIKASMSGGAPETVEDTLEPGGLDFDHGVADTLEPETPSLADADAQLVEDELADSAPDNSFDFDAVAADDSEEEEDLGIDLSSEDLELDLDIDLEGEAGTESESSPETDLDTDAESDAADTIEFESSDEVLEQDESAAADLAPELDETDDIDASVLDLDEDLESEAEPVADASDLELDAELPVEDSSEAELAPESDSVDEIEDAALDLELGDLELSEELEQESEIELPEDLSLPDEVLELDQDQPVEPTEAEPEDEVEASDAETLEPEEEAVVSDDILDEAVEAMADSDELEAELGEDEDFDFLNGTDEASTKLDLARAYIDMGDVDGARDILQEVEKEGNEEQQAEAKDLIESLNK